jgi:TP901 family phage tail tape measure protein
LQHLEKLVKIISTAIKTFTKFEFQMAKVRAITGSTDKDFKKLKCKLLNSLGKTTFFTASQVAELQVNFGKLGFSTQEILAAQEATLLLATATDQI